MRCFLPSWLTQTKSDHSRQQSRNHLGPPAIENYVPDSSIFLQSIYICIFLDRDGHAGLTGLRARKLCPPTASPLFAQSNLDNLLFRYFKILYTNGSVNYVHRQPASFCTE